MAEVANALLRYLSDRLDVEGLFYARTPAPVPNGWVTYVFHFELQDDPRLPPEFHGPLTLRLFATANGMPHGRHEFAVQAHLRRLGYPVPAPLCWEESTEILGGPFLVMEQIVGPTLLHRVFRWPLTVLSVARRMAEMQRLLHRLPADGFPDTQGPLLEGSLDEMAEAAAVLGLHRLTPGLRWLRENQPPPPSPSIVHLDFHPLNLIHRPRQQPAVLDWDTAAVGDPHADIATTLMLLRCATNVGTTLWQRMMIASGRELLRSCYLRACRRRMALDDGVLTYYEAWATLRRLTTCARWLISGPAAAGAKPSLVRHLPLDHLRSLCQEFERLTGVRIRLEEDAWAVQPT